MLNQCAGMYPAEPNPEKLVTPIDMIIDSKDVYSQHKLDIGQTKQKLHATLKPNSELRE